MFVFIFSSVDSHRSFLILAVVDLQQATVRPKTDSPKTDSPKTDTPSVNTPIDWPNPLD